MEHIWKDLLLSILPLFVALDAPGVVPIFMALTSEVPREKKPKLVRDACLTALIVSILFLLGGRYFFSFLGITDNDFRVAGGAVLLILAITELIFPQMGLTRGGGAADSDLGVVPIGIPLIMGPAGLTTILILLDTHGFVLTIISIIANLLFVYITFSHADKVIKLMGEGGSKALSKVMALFLVAIAVMMIRVGLVGMLHAG